MNDIPGLYHLKIAICKRRRVVPVDRVAGSAIDGSGAPSALLSAIRTFQARRLNREVPGTLMRFQALCGPYSEENLF